MKKINRSLVLEMIRSEQPISRAKIAKQLSLSRSTVSQIVDELIEKMLVVELGYGSSTSGGGRRAVELGFNPKSAYGLGVDIGGTKILIVVTDLDGEVIFKEKVKTTNNISEIIRLIMDALSKNEIPLHKIIGMGVGVPGIANVEEGVIYEAPALNWTNINLREELSEHFPFPIFINNDVNCAALGERWLGSGKNSDDLFFIVLGTGVGSAIIANGELLMGSAFRSGEIAYNVCEEDLRDNPGLTQHADEFGLFEKKVSGTALGSHGFSSEQLFEEYNSGNEKAAAIIDKFTERLSIQLCNVINLLNPEKVVIGGGVSESMETVIQQIREKVDALTPIKTYVELASLGGDAGGLGAIAYAFQQVEESDYSFEGGKVIEKSN